MCWGCVRGYFQSDKGLYCDVIFLCGEGCQIFTSHPVLFAPTICKLSSIFSRRNKSTRNFVPRFRRLETRSLSHFRSRLVANPTKLWLLFDTYMYLRWLNRVMQDHEARASDLNRKLIFSFFLLFS